jgi:hypothetical protein
MVFISQAMLMAKKNWDKLLPDILITILYYLLLDKMMAWQYNNPSLSCSLLMILNIIAVSFGCLFFFSLYADDDQLLAYKKLLPKWQSAALGLSVFICVFGFMWWLVPFAAAKKLGVEETGFIAGLVAYFICFMGTVVYAIGQNKKKLIVNTYALKGANVIITTVFFFYSYAFLKMGLQNAQPIGLTEELVSLVCLIIFYLPLRFFLLLRPPHSRLEYIVFFLSFANMLYLLFVKNTNY